MKNLLLSLSLLVNIGVLFYACKKGDTAPNKTDIETASTTTKSQNNFALRISDDEICSGSFTGMQFGEVEEMIRNYRANQYHAIKAQLGMEDARACWFDLNRLKEFICKLERLVESSGCPEYKDLGIRFYYGAHNSTVPLNGVPDNYARKHNVILIPTYTDSRGFNVDFNPFNSTCDGSNGFKTTNGNTPNTFTPNATNPTTTIFAMDQGQLGPPIVEGMNF